MTFPRYTTRNEWNLIQHELLAPRPPISRQTLHEIRLTRKAAGQTDMEDPLGCLSYQRANTTTTSRRMLKQSTPFQRPRGHGGGRRVWGPNHFGRWRGVGGVKVSLGVGLIFSLYIGMKMSTVNRQTTWASSPAPYPTNTASQHSTSISMTGKSAPWPEKASTSSLAAKRKKKRSRRIMWDERSVNSCWMIGVRSK